MTGYVLLSHGAKPARPKDIADHPAARQQVANLRWLRDTRAPEADIVFIHDHARKIRGPASLTILFRALETMKGAGKGLLPIDDLSRIFRVCPGRDRADLMTALLGLGDHLTDLRHCGLEPLGTMDRDTVMRILHAQEDPRFVLARPETRPRSETSRRRQTKDAHKASVAARAKAADEKAAMLDRIRQQLHADGSSPTFAAIADAANSAGEMTTRGNPWTPAAVRRALQRLE